MTILLFGITKDIVGNTTLSLSHSEAKTVQTVGQLRRFLTGTYPEISRLSSLAIAVNNEYAEDEREIKHEDEIALIPPVSGG
ncbi:MAG: MoaD/ThiS family protein [Eudoraea sp.]|nr:MoaD/ThiS family protein [Eudoraea sp.]MBT8321921.1 MoaD/ThiS family protein [Eudoraea sp.]NNK30967.1 MoaD/ThiS family protein [Flavobacteriaceae bacterium]